MSAAIQPAPATINDAFTAFDDLAARLERIEILLESNNDDLGEAVHQRPASIEYRVWCIFTLAGETLAGVRRDLHAVQNRLIELGAF
ncbi:hypothetical protein H5J25_13755 [Sphingomonas aliaeris]|uniref:Uncharacterized protein n=1 Tax=Sphingomonas aliaeris TaxID=2759526 RepID=A0A974S3Y4_9SPHN|nr:hypothetical protein [Sphingomonas aliaeris]QQV76510.1 hypothetical protein H5J25_13755 [Sphingomonas aliaeris]